jgi:hypothetical protein
MRAIGPVTMPLSASANSSKTHEPTHPRVR